MPRIQNLKTVKMHKKKFFNSLEIILNIWLNHNIFIGFAGA